MFRFGSKAGVLEQLRDRLKISSIPHFLSFSQAEWKQNPAFMLQNILAIFKNDLVIVRSSSMQEDGAVSSMAGAYLSLANVELTGTVLQGAIDAVFASYKDKNPDHQIIVQAMVRNVGLSGVVFTVDPQTHLPYYIIEYDDETGRSDSITSGSIITKSLSVLKGSDEAWLTSPRMRQIISAVCEIEQLTGSDKLDIEFIVDGDGIFWVLQVRPIATQPEGDIAPINKIRRHLAGIEKSFSDLQKSVPGMYGRSAVFADMSDWNPAEMIGRTPDNLSYSLYRTLITRSVWREARQAMGYRALPEIELMHRLDGHPYIDVRASMNSFCPAGLPDHIGETLINAWLHRLSIHQDLHDKIEFDVCTSCYVPSHDKIMNQRYPALLSEKDAAVYADVLLNLTNNAVLGFCESNLVWCRQQSNELERIEKPQDMSRHSLGALIEQCITFGTRPFAAAARHAFIAEHILRSLVEESFVSKSEAEQVNGSIETVSSDIIAALCRAQNGSLSADEFHATYGHLRPNSYDILSYRYDGMPNFIEQFSSIGTGAVRKKIKFTHGPNLDDVFSRVGYKFNSVQFYDYLAESRRLRELIKFRFTRVLSDILELVAQLAAKEGLDRRQASYLNIEDLLIGVNLKTVVAREKSYAASMLGLRANYILCSPRDFYVVPIQRGQPNFITDRRVAGKRVVLDSSASPSIDLSGMIVCIERADPGFDWIFFYRIKGLVTMYGGANSHMAIRCMEFSIPAAIGCGEAIYRRLEHAAYIEMDCGARKIDPLLSAAQA